MLHTQKSIPFAAILAAVWSVAVGPAVISTEPTAEAGTVQIVVRGRPTAVVVTPDDPSPVTQYAAEELVAHVKKATGATLPVVKQSAGATDATSRIFLGPTSAAREQGIDDSALGPDVFVMRTDGNDLHIVGRDRQDNSPLSESTRYSGTMFGVYEFLERYLNVRWLWPGELGTYVPRTGTLVIRDRINETIEPVLKFRKIRWGHVRNMNSDYSPEIERMAFSHDTLRAYTKDLGVYLRRHRMGQTERKPSTGHAFGRWWKKHGKKHPDWFRMNKQGERVGPTMCVSNPDLHDYILRTQRRAHRIRLGEADSNKLCQCERCLSWDGPQPSKPPRFARRVYQPQVASDRYARFWLTIYEGAKQRKPDVVVTTLLYQHCFPAPQQSIRLNENFFGEFVPSGDQGIGRFPVNSEAYEWLKEQWLGWRRTGITMGYRPNLLYAGYAMPYLGTRQVGEFFRFAYRNGMIGTDFDKLHGQWAVQGPQLYVIMRLHVDPTQSVERIVQEYYEAFGPAASHVERYFNYWEDHTLRQVNRGRYSTHDRLERNRMGTAHGIFPPKSFGPAANILGEAGQAAERANNPDYAQRVEFLKLGLQHARLCTRLTAAMADEPQPQPGTDAFRRAQQAVRELVAFRRKHEATYIVDLASMAQWENSAVTDDWTEWNLDPLFPQD